MTIQSVVTHAKTALFVPGNSRRRYMTASSSGADLIVVDWEDSVPPAEKASARSATIDALVNGTPDGAPFCAIVRVDSSRLFDDLELLSSVSSEPGQGLLGVMLPKCQFPETLSRVLDMLSPHLAVIPLIESALGLHNVDEIASAGVSRLAFGAFDFALDTSADREGPLLDYSRSRLVLASRIAELPLPLDSPVAEFGDTHVVAQAARRARAFGFGGIMCIHPKQVLPAAEALRPDAAEIAWAAQVLATDPGAGRIATQMVDYPVQSLARRIAQRSME